MTVPTTQVTGHSTDIEGLLWFDVTLVGDDRGYFQEKFHKQKLVAQGLPDTFDVVQNSITFNKLGVTRGFHAEPWEKYVSVLNGEAFVAYVDLRPGAGFGRVVTFTIDPQRCVYIPRGVANAYQSLTDEQYYLYSVNAHWTESAYDRYSFVNLADESLGVDWPIGLDEAILSERDRRHPALPDARPFE